MSKSLLVDPVVEFRSVKVDIDEHLIYYANVISNSASMGPDAVNEASDALRQDASQLESRANNIRGYQIWSNFGMLPNRNEVTEAKQNLIGISNMIYYTNSNRVNGFDPVIEIHEMREEVRSLLDING